MSIDVGYVEKLVKLLEDSSLTEMFLQDGEQIVELKRGCVEQQQNNKYSSTVHSVVEKIAPVDITSEQKSEQKPEKKIISPMVGTFYSATAPNAKPLVQVGDTVATGQVVCIIEAMKLMNEIEAEVSGKVVEICVEDGQPVEYGQVLMYIE